MPKGLKVIKSKFRWCIKLSKKYHVKEKTYNKPKGCVNVLHKAGFEPKRNVNFYTVQEERVKSPRSSTRATTAILTSSTGASIFALSKRVKSVSKKCLHVHREGVHKPEPKVCVKVVKTEVKSKNSGFLPEPKRGLHRHRERGRDWHGVQHCSAPTSSQLIRTHHCMF